GSRLPQPDSLSRRRPGSRLQFAHSLGARERGSTHVHYERAAAHSRTRRRNAMKLITHVDPSQLRLGYLSCLALVAGRQLDTKQGLVDRLTRFVFQTVDAEDPRWPSFMEGADRDELKRLKPEEDEKTVALRELFRIIKPDVE